MIWNVSYVVGSAVGSGGAARPGAEGIVSRPRLVGRLGASARVTVGSAPPGSGKTVLLRSWISQAGAASCAGWVPVGRAKHDPPQFWLSALAALRQTDLGALLVQPLTPAPDLDGWAITDRLPLESRHVESAQNTGQLQTDIVAPGAFMVHIRRPATDEDRQQE